MFNSIVEKVGGFVPVSYYALATHPTISEYSWSKETFKKDWDEAD